MQQKVKKSFVFHIIEKSTNSKSCHIFFSAVNSLSDNDSEAASREASPVCTDSPRIVESSPNENVNEPQEVHSENLCVNSANLNSVASMTAIEKEDTVNCNSDSTINGKRQSANLHVKVNVNACVCVGVYA